MLLSIISISIWWVGAPAPGPGGWGGVGGQEEEGGQRERCTPTLPGAPHQRQALPNKRVRYRIHYTQTMALHTDTALRVFGDSIAADNQYVIIQSVVATSVIYMIYAAVMFALSLWRALLEVEIDVEGGPNVALRGMGQRCNRGPAAGAL
jgi:hypothetical protein